ncbi:hypothetical protein Cob_v003904 [Colletotrichum orbiculare MAFF 240422]|uniref:Extracellular membrane protein CFEM domain-containing protein n=1 Tax=Colletotrichum orbiculare (strain 104-T / ATCC 96160 / CBS 514.97 / LARS 414 / MAFF 240422) TaxID=1213857 RepID=A0A484FZD2_COLOR|nr:hypothetical protein Cob_v003904 [Colletotrichum orbiculare MAFF 240422]
MEWGTCTPEEEEAAWAKIASNVPDPPLCIEQCKERFFELVVPEYDDSKFPQVCESLSKNSTRLWEVYCCDSVGCGVSNGNSGASQDPNANHIILECQKRGAATVQDPGPPPSKYSCPAIASPQDCQKAFMLTGYHTATETPDYIKSLYATESSITATSTMSTQISSRPATSSSGISTSTKSQEESFTAGLPIGARIAIGTSCGIALLAILAVITFADVRKPSDVAREQLLFGFDNDDARRGPSLSQVDNGMRHIPWHPAGSMTSSASNRTTATASNNSNNPSYSSPSSSPAHLRPVDASLSASNIGYPGPPPTRALPTPPPLSPRALAEARARKNSRYSSASTVTGAPDFPPRNPARGYVVGREARDLYDLTESYALETKGRDSWGSWTAGGGGAAAATTSRQKGPEVRLNSPVLEEADLARMAGTY